MFIQFSLDDSSTRQISISDIVTGREARSARFEFRYLEAANHWVVTISDAATDETLCLHVPIVASYTRFNDLLAMYRYKGIGSLVCVPVTDNPSSVDPQFGNADEFAIVWGDDFGQSA